MRSFPDFAEITALLRSPLPHTVLARGRYVVGALAAAGSLAVFHGGAGTAEAHPVAPKAKAPVTSQKPAPTAVRTYTIKAGDTLSGIALRVGVPVPAIAAANGIANPDKIIAGARLVVPGTSAAPPPPPPANPIPPKVSGASVKGAGDLSAPKPSAGQALPQLAAAKPERARLVPHFRKAAADHGVPAELLMSLTWQESGWQNKVKSSAGAVGIGQLMPDTVAFINEVLLAKPLDPAVPEQNIKMSAAFLRYLLDQTGGDPRLAVAAYYQGLGATQRVGIYDETKAYVRSVFAIQGRWF